VQHLIGHEVARHAHEINGRRAGEQRVLDLCERRGRAVLAPCALGPGEASPIDEDRRIRARIERPPRKLVDTGPDFPEVPLGSTSEPFELERPHRALFFFW
jgi:hypothetical protein